MEKKLFKKNDLLLIGILLIIFAGIMIFLSITREDGSMVQVSVNGELAASFPLSEDIEYEIEGCNGGSNTLVIQDGWAYIRDSSCPDHLCEKMGRINSSGQSLICLPNRVIVEITGTEDEYDAVAGG